MDKSMIRMTKDDGRGRKDDGRMTKDDGRGRKKTFWFLIMIIIVFSSLVLLPSSIVYAAVPHLINYQGRLTDTSGSPLNGTYNITFRIYDTETAGNLLWQGTYAGTSIAKGIFNILLGDVSDTGFNFSNLAFDKPYWLEIKVETDAPMTPRQRITSSGYAITAERLVDEPLPAARGGTGSTAAANAANGVVVLDASSRLPAVNGSLLTNVSGGVTQVNDTDAGTSFAAETTLLSVAKTITSGKTVLLIATGYLTENTENPNANQYVDVRLKHGTTIVQAIRTLVTEKTSWAVSGIVTGLSGSTTFSVTFASGTVHTGYGNLEVLEF